MRDACARAIVPMRTDCTCGGFNEPEGHAGDCPVPVLRAAAETIRTRTLLGPQRGGREVDRAVGGRWRRALNQRGNARRATNWYLVMPRLIVVLPDFAVSRVSRGKSGRFQHVAAAPVGPSGIAWRRRISAEWPQKLTGHQLKSARRRSSTLISPRRISFAR